jgi:hypothetical protein
MELKFCPLRKKTIKTDVNATVHYFDNCIGSACAWYVNETKECAIKCMATRLESGEVEVLCHQVKE